jgi:hypothetical protein
LVSEAGFKSFLTVHVYLNDVGEGGGGATRFFAGDLAVRGGDSGEEEDVEDGVATTLDVSPQAGSVLVFQQRDLWHEGCEVLSGEKITFRGNVFYERVS